MAGGREITAEEVITKLKDDGDFDRLRLKIIRKLKDNEELRGSITEVVKQSAALNRPGAESMKPRELSDVIHDEVRDKVMSQISDGLWEIIRSTDGMKAEITDAVQSIYDKLNSPAKTEDHFASSSHVLPRQDITQNGAAQLHCGQLNESAAPDSQIRIHDEQHPGPGQASGHSDEEDGDSSPPPGFSISGNHKDLSDGSDDELDAPPGFG